MSQTFFHRRPSEGTDLLALSVRSNELAKESRDTFSCHLRNPILCVAKALHWYTTKHQFFLAK
jgi:hypothetical protein